MNHSQKTFLSKKNFGGILGGNLIKPLRFIKLPPKVKTPRRLERQGIPLFNTKSNIDHVPIGEPVYDTYPTQFP
jgi:hypothetical protein